MERVPGGAPLTWPIDWPGFSAIRVHNDNKL